MQEFIFGKGDNSIGRSADDPKDKHHFNFTKDNFIISPCLDCQTTQNFIDGDYFALKFWVSRDYAIDYHTKSSTGYVLLNLTVKPNSIKSIYPNIQIIHYT